MSGCGENSYYGDFCPIPERDESVNTVWKNDYKYNTMTKANDLDKKVTARCVASRYVEADPMPFKTETPLIYQFYAGLKIYEKYQLSANYELDAPGLITLVPVDGAIATTVSIASVVLATLVAF